jgi:hypothetical protein
MKCGEDHCDAVQHMQSKASKTQVLNNKSTTCFAQLAEVGSFMLREVMNKQAGLLVWLTN